MEEKSLELESRRKIYEAIEQVPGIHFRELNRRLGIPLGVIEYHLKYLEKSELIVSKRAGRYKRYYIVGKLGSRDKQLLGLLQQPMPRRILMHLLLHPKTTQKELRKEFKISASTLSFHISKLLDTELILTLKIGRKHSYKVADEEAVAKALIRYKEGFVDELVDDFVDTWMEIHP
ncbi:winged helix-turn-helix transcriptional regulator [[Eubacterium] cellulosolvens]